VSELPEEVQNTALADLGLSPRVLNALRSKQIEKVGQVAAMDPEELLSIRNFGPRSLKELRAALESAGLVPGGESDGLADDTEDDLETREAAEAIASLGGADDGVDNDDEIPRMRHQKRDASSVETRPSARPCFASLPFP